MDTDDTPAGSGRARPRRILVGVLTALGFVAVALLLRGGAIATIGFINPDEVELMAQARAALGSPVPFTTWTMGTTGPTWPLALVLLSLLGFPLTVAAAHVLSAVLTGLLGAGIFFLARRNLSPGWALVLTAAWWGPLVIVVPVLGYLTDFAALSTEYLPAVLLVVVALIGLRERGGRPWALVAGGVLGMLAVGAKFQIAPLAFALLLIIAIRTRDTLGSRVRAVLWIGLGAAIPALVLILALVLSPDVQDELVAQQFGFLGSYADGTDLATRIGNTVAVLNSARWYLLAIGIGIVWLVVRSDAGTALARIALVVAGLVAVFAGGRGFGHYLIILIAALGLAMALPLRNGLSPLPGRRALPALAALTAVALGAIAAFGLTTGRVALLKPQDLAVALSPDSAPRDAALERWCPPGSTVVVWGWAPELYLAHDWVNGIPYFNILGLVQPGPVHDQALPVVLDGLERADCVVEALGQPFFAVGPESSIDAVYPETRETLVDRFRVREGALADCPACVVYVSR